MRPHSNTGIGKWKKRVAAVLPLIAGAVLLIPALSAPAHAEGVDKVISRSEVIARGHYWVQRNVQYSQSAYTNGAGESKTYRTDCSGFISMAWHLPTSRWTGNLGEVSTTISYSSLKPGDILMRNPSSTSGHVVMFERWANSAHTSMWILEQASTASDMNYRTVTVSDRQANGYKAYRYKKIRDDVAGSKGDLTTSGARCSTTAYGTINLKARRDVYVVSYTCLKYDSAAKKIRGHILVKWSPGRNSDDSSNTTRTRFDGFTVHSQLQLSEVVKREARCNITTEINRSINSSKSCAVQISAPTRGKWSADGFLQWNEDADGKYWMGPAYVGGSPYWTV